MSDRQRDQRDQRDDDRRSPRRVPLLPLRDIIVFPHMVVPLFVGREQVDRRARRGDGAATRRSSSRRSRRRRPTSRRPRTSSPSARVGTIIQLLRLPDGTGEGARRGQARARASARFVADRGVLPRRGRGDRRDRASRRVELEALMRSVQDDVRDLRQAQQADPARDADVGADDRRSGAARRHDRRAPALKLDRQAGAPRDRRRRRSGSSGSTS